MGTRQDMHQRKVQLTSTSRRRVEIGRRNKELYEQLSSHPGMEDIALPGCGDPEWYTCTAPARWSSAWR